MMNGEETKRDLKLRTKQYALRIIRLYSSLETIGAAGVIGRQLLIAIFVSSAKTAKK